MGTEEAVAIAIEYLGKDLFDGLSLAYSQKGEALKVRRNGRSVEITYSSLVELFRGLSLVKERIADQEYEVTLKHNFDTSGVMLDCSRNGVIKTDQVKKIILLQALMGLNRMLLYTEDTYEMGKYPFFGYLRGSYTKEELKELASYGEAFGVELVPCIQTLDHLERPFRWEAFDDIKDGDSNVFVGKEETYEFIEEMIKVSRECFKTKSIHIGMDESFRLGLGKYLAQKGYHDRVELFSQHLARVIEICKKYDFEPMIWSDMFFRLNDASADYYSGNKLPQKTLGLIPEGIQLVFWDYYHDQREVYDKMLESHLETKRKTLFAGGSWRWTGFAPALHKSYEFNKVALGSSIERGIRDVFVTAWGDNGNECSIYATLPSLAQYSAFAYFSEGIDEHADSLLRAVTGETIERMLLLDLPNMPDNKVLAAPYNPSKFFFYQDVLLGLFDKQAKDGFAANYKEHERALSKAAQESVRYSYIYKNLANLCSVLSLKVDIGVRLRNAYRAGNEGALRAIANEEIEEIIRKVDIFHDSLESQWNAENKSFGFDVLDGRIGYLKARLSTAKKVINQYLDKGIDRIEELEKEILPYGGHDYEICWNQWSSTVTVHGL